MNFKRDSFRNWTKNTCNSLALGRLFSVKAARGKLINKYIGVSVQGNYQRGIADHANEIVNSFIHEGQHYKDFKTLGVIKFMRMDHLILEQKRAIQQNASPFFFLYSPLLSKICSYVWK